MFGGCLSFLISGNVFADSYPHAGPDRPANSTGYSVPVYAGPVETNTGPVQSDSLISPLSVYYTVFVPPTNIKVSIWSRSSTGAELPNTYSKTVTVNFTEYVKDVLPNEWYESWGGSAGAQASLEAGALAVKTYGWYHSIHQKDAEHGADVKNGTSSQMYTAGSHQPNCDLAVGSTLNYVIGKVSVTNGVPSGSLVETGYLANQTTPGSIMGQNASRTDALNGMTASQIITKWYANLGVSMNSYTIIM